MKQQKRRSQVDWSLCQRQNWDCFNNKTVSVKQFASQEERWVRRDAWNVYLSSLLRNGQEYRWWFNQVYFHHEEIFSKQLTVQHPSMQQINPAKLCDSFREFSYRLLFNFPSSTSSVKIKFAGLNFSLFCLGFSFQVYHEKLFFFFESPWNVI